MLTPQDINSVDDAKRIVSERNLSHVKIGLFDIDGVMRGKYLRKEKFFAALDKGLAANFKTMTVLREFDQIFSVRPQEPEYFLPTRLAGWATLVTSGER